MKIGQSRSMSDPTLSDIDFKNKTDLVWTTLKNFDFEMLMLDFGVKTFEKFRVENLSPTPVLNWFNSWCDLTCWATLTITHKTMPQWLSLIKIDDVNRIFGHFWVTTRGLLGLSAYLPSVMLLRSFIILRNG